MLPVAYRLRRSADFADVVRRGRRIAATGVVVYASSGKPAAESSDLPQVGFIVGKSVGPAVVRNTVRRRLRHLMAQRRHRLPEGARLVVRATANAAGRPASVLGRALDLALDSAFPLAPSPVSGPRHSATIRPVGPVS